MDLRSRSKHWFVRINNVTEEDRLLIRKHTPAFSYCVFANHIADDGTPFLSGYVAFIKRKYWTGAKKLFPRALIRMKDSTLTIAECITYCKKQGICIEYGIPPRETSTKIKKYWDFPLQPVEQNPMDLLIRYYIPLLNYIDFVQPSTTRKTKKWKPSVLKWQPYPIIYPVSKCPLELVFTKW